MSTVPKHRNWRGKTMGAVSAIALLVAAAGAADAESGKRFYRGEWRNFAQEAAKWEREAAIALEAKDDHAAFRAFHKLAFVEADRWRFVPMQRAAEASVSIGEKWFATGRRPELVTYRERIFHLESRGLVEKGLTAQGRLAEGQAQLRRMREGLEALHVTEHGGSAASLRDFTELDRWHERSLFLLWELVERETLHLSRAGRDNEAVTILRPAVEAARRSRTGERIDAFYEIQLAPKLAARLRDLGYVREAVAVLEEFMREWDGDRVRFAEQYWRARVQFALYRSELDGPGQALLHEAEEAHEKFASSRGSGIDHWSESVVAFMRHQLRPSPESERELRRIEAQMREHDEILDSLSARQDALRVGNDFARPGREQEFIDLLEADRRVGNKSHEPPVYQSYGDYLLALGRPVEAVPIYREALRQVEGFGWRVLVPHYRLSVIAALIRLGDFAAVEAEWAALDRIVAATNDLPPERVLEVSVARARWLAQSGREAAARSALAAARAFADGQKLNAWQRRDLDTLDLATFSPVAVQTKRQAVPVTLQPIKIETEAAPGDPLRARFALRNPASTARAGTLVARGPAARLSIAGDPRRVLGTGVVGGAMVELRLPLTMLGGEDLPVVLEMKGEARGTKSEIGWELAWREDAAAAPQTSTWRIRSDDQPFVTVVLNANELRRNPFYAVSFTHQIVHRDPRATLENIRFLASAPLRLECYDAATGRLLAVDAEGNGEFTDPGDLLLEDADANRALDLAFAAGEHLREIEVFVFTPASATGDGKLTVDVELLTPTGWEKSARNELGRE